MKTRLKIDLFIRLAPAIENSNRRAAVTNFDTDRVDNLIDILQQSLPNDIENVLCLEGWIGKRLMFWGIFEFGSRRFKYGKGDFAS